jgi:hypothetical protein
MTERESSQHGETIRLVAEVLKEFGEAAAGQTSCVDAARGWIEAGYDDPEEISEWLRARCFSPQGAAALERAGITPEQAALRTRAGSSDYEETIAFKFTRGDLSHDEARRIVTNDFWNS